jgi:hypothetical protein
MGATATSPCPSAEAAVCDGCGGRITDRYYLVTVDRQWHSACLKCCECKLALDSQVSCFVKDGNIYCKEDFYRYGRLWASQSSAECCLFFWYFCRGLTKRNVQWLHLWAKYWAVDGCLLGCCTVRSGRKLPTFQRCLQPPWSWGNNREDSLLQNIAVVLFLRKISFVQIVK